MVLSIPSWPQGKGGASQWWWWGGGLAQGHPSSVPGWWLGAG